MSACSMRQMYNAITMLKSLHAEQEEYTGLHLALLLLCTADHISSLLCARA